MNPEEGELRPQLLDRFGLLVDVADLVDSKDRAEAVRRRLEFESDAAGFREKWKSAELRESQQIVRAQQLLAKVSLSEDLLQAISERCLAAGVDGLRADLTMAKAAAAWAAYQGRTEVEPADLDVVAELALAHRRNTQPVPPPPDRGSKNENQEPSRAKTPSREESLGGLVSSRETIFNPRSSILNPQSSILPSSGLFIPRLQPDSEMLSDWRGRWRQGIDPTRGRARGYLRAYGKDAVLSWAGTIRAASVHQLQRGRAVQNGAMVLRIDDLRGWPKRGPGGCLLLFVVDASGSMAARQRMRQTKSAILSLLLQSYQRRDRIALLAFRGIGTELVLPPTCDLHSALRAVERLPVGGATPLALGLLEAKRLAHRQQRRQPRQPIWLILLTDGRANIALRDGDPWTDTLTAGRALKSHGLQSLVIDTETGWPRFDRARELAQAMGAPCIPLNEVLGRPLPERQRVAG
jgi:magnesium chelatase subunit D